MNTLTDKAAANAQTAISYNAKAGDEKPVYMTGEGIICFKPWLSEPRTSDNGAKNYELAVAFPASCPALKDIGERVVAFKKNPNVWGDARKIVMPFKKGNDYCETYLSDTELTPEEVAEFEERYGWMRGYVFFNAKTKFDLNEDEEKPQLIDRLRRLQDPAKVYGGAVVRLMIAPFKYDTSGKKGVSLGLRGCQVLKDAEPWGGGQRDTASAFAAQGEPEEDDAAGAFGEPEEPEVDTPEVDEAAEKAKAEAAAKAKAEKAAKAKAAREAKKKAEAEAKAAAEAEAEPAESLEDDDMFG